MRAARMAGTPVRRLLDMSQEEELGLIQEEARAPGSFVAASEVTASALRAAPRAEFQPDFSAHLIDTSSQGEGDHAETHLSCRSHHRLRQLWGVRGSQCHDRVSRAVSGKAAARGHVPAPRAPAGQARGQHRRSLDVEAGVSVVRGPCVGEDTPQLAASWPGLLQGE